MRYILNIVGSHEIGLKGTHGSGFRSRKLQTSSLIRENSMKMANSMKIPWLSWKILDIP